MAGDTHGFSNDFALGRISLDLGFFRCMAIKLVARRIAIAAVRIIFKLLVRVFGRFGRNGSYKPVILY
jgi:hypothetical protein